MRIKHFSYLVIGVVSALLYGCVKEYIISHEYIYVNKTSHIIRMKVENSNYMIASDSTLSIGKWFRGEEIPPPTSFTPPIIDSLVFDNQKCYTPNFDEGPNAVDNFEILEITKSQFQFVYNLTDIDYIKAIECN